jgi:hypothetical protein
MWRFICSFDECHYAVVMLGVIMLSDVMLSVMALLILLEQ